MALSMKLTEYCPSYCMFVCVCTLHDKCFSKCALCLTAWQISVIFCSLCAFKKAGFINIPFFSNLNHLRKNHDTLVKLFFHTPTTRPLLQLDDIIIRHHYTSRQPTSLHTGTSVLSSLRLLTLTICHIQRPPVAQPSVWTHTAAAHMNDMGNHSSGSICSTHSLSL